MTQPPGFVDSKHPHHVCRLKKALYGLKQAPRAWYHELCQYLFSAGFANSQSDAFLFILKQMRLTIFVLVYVDDIIIKRSDPVLVQKAIQKLAERFPIKDLGPLSYILGVEVLPCQHMLFSLVLTEAEYSAIAATAAELAWIQSLMHELGLSSTTTPTLYCDNLGATYLSTNPVFHSRRKHVVIDFHFVRKKVQNGSLRVSHVSSNDKLADALTKLLSPQRLENLRIKIGVHSMNSILKGHNNESESVEIMRL